MKLYTCGNCGNTLYFENIECLNCRHPVGFDPLRLSMVTLGLAAAGVLGVSGAPEVSGVLATAESFRYCRNADYGVCNWLIPADSSSIFCTACALNRMIPGLDSDSNRLKWRFLEEAKHRLIYSLLKLRLPFHTKGESIVFDFMGDMPNEPRVTTGHSNGLITINISEADEAERARSKQYLGERYRTLLGHFRHEIGHFYWDVLIRDGSAIDTFRQLFGDERLDYTTALEYYYNHGAAADWMERFVSPYATAHPWEDWAETWAHYLHMMDTLETAGAFGIRIEPDVSVGFRTAITTEPYGVTDFYELVSRWLPLSFAMNSLNRSMGHVDFYPFVLSEPVIGKLAFIHGLCLRSTP